MPRLTPIQHSFTMGELSPLMYGRSDVDGYREGVLALENMIPDSRGPAISRKGSKFIQAFEGPKGRVFSLPINENFFYTAVFTFRKLTISSASGHIPREVLNLNPHFNNLGSSWDADSQGGGSVEFLPSVCLLSIDDTPTELAQVSQRIIGLDIDTDYHILWALSGSYNGVVRVGTAEGLGDLYEQSTSSSTHPDHIVNTGPNTSVWISVALDSEILQEAQEINLHYLALAKEAPGALEFVTNYTNEELDDLQMVQSPLGDSVYILHGRKVPWKLEYDAAEDAIDWVLVDFTSRPTEWGAENFPVTGTFFQGRLWLGGPPNNNTTFWGSKSGLPEDFTLGAEADEAVQFTLNRFGAIQWMAGFKTLMMGTIYAEHIIQSEGAFIAPQDIDVQQQSAYGSALIQPVQVGDQIFYVSADRRKLRAIQYEWQADNWLSKDLTFNSEHITESGIKRIVWHQNPKNLLHCILQDGSMATMTFERSSDTYGWCRTAMQGHIQDAASAPIQGTDYLHGLVHHGDNRLYMETQAQAPGEYNMDSNVERLAAVGDDSIVGLEHLEGMTVQVQVNGAIFPDQEVINGQIEIGEDVSGIAVIGLGFLCKLTTLPFEIQMGEGSNAAYSKRRGQVVLRVLASGRPKINGIRPATRHPATPMNTVEPLRTEDIDVVELGYDKTALVTVEQDLPLDLTIVSLFGKMSTSIT